MERFIVRGGIATALLFVLACTSQAGTVSTPEELAALGDISLGGLVIDGTQITSFSNNIIAGSVTFPATDPWPSISIAQTGHEVTYTGRARGDIEKKGPGTFILGNYDPTGYGVPRFNLTDGLFKLAALDTRAPAAGRNVPWFRVNGGTLDINGLSVRCDQLFSNPNNTSGTVTSSALVTAEYSAKAPSYYYGRITGNINMKVDFYVGGTTPIAFMGTTDYQGTTTVSSGALTLGNGLTGAGGDVVVDGGATWGATMNANGAVERHVAVGKGILNAGWDRDGGYTLLRYGDLTVNSMALSANAITLFDILTPDGGSLGTHDIIHVNGDFALDGVVRPGRSYTGSPSFEPGTYRLFTYGGQLTDNGATVDMSNLPAGWTGEVIAGNGVVDVQITAPEPATVILLLAGSAGVLLRRRTAA